MTVTTRTHLEQKLWTKMAQGCADIHNLYYRNNVELSRHTLVYFGKTTKTLKISCLINSMIEYDEFSTMIFSKIIFTKIILPKIILPKIISLLSLLSLFSPQYTQHHSIARILLKVLNKTQNPSTSTSTIIAITIVTTR